MNQYPNIKLHSKYLSLTFWAGILLFPPVFPLLFYIVFAEGFTVKSIVFATLFAALFVLAVYLLFNLTKAEIKDDQLHLKKFFRPKKVYDFTDLKSIKTFKTGNARHIQISGEGLKIRHDIYIFFKMEKNGKEEQYLLVGYNFFLGDEATDGEEILRQILADNKQKAV